MTDSSARARGAAGARVGGRAPDPATREGAPARGGAPMAGPRARRALAVGGVSLALAYFRTGLGLGDVKLGAVIGLWLGWLDPWMLVFGLSVGVFLGGIAALFLLITRQASRKDPMAYGPYLIAGALLTWPLAIV